MSDRNFLLNHFNNLLSFLSEYSNMILPVIAMFSVVILLLGKLYHLIRVKFPVKVNCWFCNSYSSVPYNSANSWYCPQCDQYNGFSSDGSYNRILAEQFNEKLNFGSWCSKTKHKGPNTNGLCRFCNINVELKVHQLAQFVPLNMANYDEEVQQFSDKLDRVYRLCSRCQGFLDKTLNKKQELYFTNQETFKTAFNYSDSQVEKKERHPVYLAMTATLSLCLLLTTIPYSWWDYLATVYPPTGYLHQLIKTILTAVPAGVLPGVFPLIGMVVQLLDSIYMRDSTSLVNLLIWVILFTLPYSPVIVDGLVSYVQMFASIVFFTKSVMAGLRSRGNKIIADRPIRFQKLDEKAKMSKCTKLPDFQPTTKPTLSTPVSEPTFVPDPCLSPEKPTEDFGLSKLNVSSRRVTRSQVKPFQPKNYTGATKNEIFRPKPVNLTPPKLQFDKISEYQVPMTRSSSQSSGFVSLSHQKDFYEDRTPSIINDNIDSVSQCEGVLSPYSSPFPSPVPFHQYGPSPFSQFHPYTIMHFTPSSLGKFYPYHGMSLYEPSLNFSSSTIASQRGFENISWFQYVKNTLSSLLFLFLITSNVAILWKVFGEEYFKVKT